MIETLLKLGKQLEAGNDRWDSKLEDRTNKLIPNGNKKLYVLNIIFDVDNKEIQLSPENLQEFDPDSSVKTHWLFQTFPARAGKTYVATLFDKVDDLKISLIGKKDKKNPAIINDGDFIKDINNKFPIVQSTEFYKALCSLKVFKTQYEEISKQSIAERISLPNNEVIIFCYASIINSELGIQTPTEMAYIDDFEDYLNLKFAKPVTDSKLCYASGKIEEGVNVASYEKRGGINAMFVKTTLNYVSHFNLQNLANNYQLSNENSEAIENAGFFLLKNYTTSIAGIRHVIIPQFLHNEEVDFELALDKINTKSDFLFKVNDNKKLNTSLLDESDDNIYWLNFMAIDTDGKSFKATELIKDVSKPYFLKIIETFEKVNMEFYKLLNLNHFLNFYTFYQYIPVKKDIKKNEALSLFKDVFEHRPIDKDLLFKYFSRYLICQKSKQFDKGFHKAYSNIKEQTEFDYAIKNSVNAYLAFIEALKKLNLININTMDENITKSETVETSSKDYGQQVESYFDKMGYTETQKALFYLGRILNQVAYAQKESSHPTKPILNKINYNGMDKDAVLRLYLDLQEKVRQYVNKINLTSVEFNFSKFTQYYNPNNPIKWLSPEENVFYILTGYSFYTKMKEDNNKKPQKTDN